MLPDVTIIPRQGTNFEDDVIISSSLSLVVVSDLLNNDSDEEPDLKLPANNQQEMLQMVHVALYLQKLILEHDPNEEA